MIYREMLNTILSELEERKRRLEVELKSAPAGALNIRSQNGRNYYSVRYPKVGNRKKVYRKGISGDKRLVRALVRKKYLEQAVAGVEKDIHLIRKVLKEYVDTNEESVMHGFLERYPELRNCIYGGRQSDREWASDYMPVQGLHDENLKSTSASGAKMRSKGELIIAGRLDYYHIPYRYEDQYRHPDLDRVPDFKIRRPRDGKIIYWEHFGLVNDEGYMENTGLKLTEYEVHEIVPWDNLIITYDQKDGGIDVRIIDAMIQGWLL